MRISITNLESIVRIINRKAGTPETSYTTIDGKSKPNEGNYHLDWAYGGVKLCQMESAGCSDVTSSGFVSKKTLYFELRAFMAGLEANNE
jgi:hypothetical protein